MRGIYHLMCSLALAGVGALAAFEGGMLSFEHALLVIMGAGIGSLLPDADAPDAHIFHSRIAVLAHATKWLVLLPASLAFSLAGVHSSRNHRQLLHSITGAFIVVGAWGIPVAVIAGSLFSRFLDPLSFLAGGVVLGWLLHLSQDAFTTDGIPLFFPLAVRFSGNVRSSAGWRVWRADHLPAAVLLLLSAGVLYLILNHALAAPFILVLEIAGIILLWLLFGGRIKN